MEKTKRNKNKAPYSQHPKAKKRLNKIVLGTLGVMLVFALIANIIGFSSYWLKASEPISWNGYTSYLEEVWHAPETANELEEAQENLQNANTQLATKEAALTTALTQKEVLEGEKLALQAEIATKNSLLLTANNQIILLEISIESLTDEKTALENAAVLDQEAIDALNAEISTLTNEKTLLEVNVLTLTDEKTALESNISALNSQILAAEITITYLQNELSVLQNYVGELEPFVLADLEINGEIYKNYSLLEGDLNWDGTRYYDNIFSELIIDITQTDETNYVINYYYIIPTSETEEITSQYTLNVDSTSVDFTGLYDAVVMGIVENSPTFNFNKTINYSSWMQLYEDLSNNLTNSYLTLETTLSNGVFVSMVNNVSINYNLVQEESSVIVSMALTEQTLMIGTSTDIYFVDMSFTLDSQTLLLTCSVDYGLNSEIIGNYEYSMNYSEAPGAGAEFDKAIALHGLWVTMSWYIYPELEEGILVEYNGQIENYTPFGTAFNNAYAYLLDEEYPGSYTMYWLKNIFGIQIDNNVTLTIV